eukprot:UN07740
MACWCSKETESSSIVTEDLCGASEYCFYDWNTMNTEGLDAYECLTNQISVTGCAFKNGEQVTEP